MLRRELLVRLGIGVLGAIIAPLVALLPAPSRAASDWRHHEWCWQRRGRPTTQAVCVHCGHTREHLIAFNKRQCSGVWEQREVVFKMNFGGRSDPDDFANAA